MHSRPLTLGRTFGVVFDHGDDFLPTLLRFCEENDVRQAYLPGFLGAFGSAGLIGACEPPADPEAPIWTRKQLEHVEAIGSGTVAVNPATGELAPHVHVATGMRYNNATGHTSHLLDATVQFVIELLVIEVTEPTILRVPHPDLYDIPVLKLDSDS
jgi:predicted DNA-binding protein with PD1-like motif